MTDVVGRIRTIAERVARLPARCRTALNVPPSRITAVPASLASAAGAT